MPYNSNHKFTFKYSEICDNNTYYYYYFFNFQQPKVDAINEHIFRVTTPLCVQVSIDFKEFGIHPGSTQIGSPGQILIIFF